jgi:hypothetical protein
MTPIAPQAWFALSTMETWSQQDGQFDMKLFYEGIVMALETDPEDPWVVETMGWWNQ